MSIKRKLKLAPRRRFYMDPANGLEVNKMHEDFRVGKKIYDVDIARSPRVERGSFDCGVVFRNIHRRATKAHNEYSRVNFMAYKFKGRR